VLLSIALLSGSAASQSSTVPTVPQSAGPLRAPEQANYLIQVNDVLQIFVWKEPEITQGRVLVRPDGRISIPLVQDMQASGLTPMQLKLKLEEKLKEYIDVPNVTVKVESIQSYKIYVMGKIARGGALDSPTPVSIMQALANAGGFTEFANKREIQIFRGNLLLSFNYEDYKEGKNLSQNIYLMSGDVVEVR
jgi:polysaccharide biosynthesis/export protein